MKIKYTGAQDEVTIRGTTFTKGKTVDVSDAALAKKVLALSEFSEVKAKRNVKNKD